MRVGAVLGLPAGEAGAEGRLGELEGGDAGGGVGGEGGDEVAERAAGLAVVDEGLGERAHDMAGVGAGELDGAGLERRDLGPAGDGVHQRRLLGPQGGELLKAERAASELFAEGGEAEQASHMRARTGAMVDRGVVVRVARLVGGLPA